jgi:hypothetical protein
MKKMKKKKMKKKKQEQGEGVVERKRKRMKYQMVVYSAISKENQCQEKKEEHVSRTCR